MHIGALIRFVRLKSCIRDLNLQPLEPPCLALPGRPDRMQQGKTMLLRTSFFAGLLAEVPDTALPLPADEREETETGPARDTIMLPLRSGENASKLRCP